MTNVSMTVRPPINPATDKLIKRQWYRGPGQEDPWLDTMERRGMQLVPRKLPSELRINGWYMDYRDGVNDYRAHIDRYLKKKQKLKSRPRWRRRLGPSIDVQLAPYRGNFCSFADVYVLDPKLAITGLEVYPDPPPISGTSTHISCQNVVVKTFAAIARHRLPDIPDNVHAVALRCLDVLLQTGLDQKARVEFQHAREAIAKRK